MPTTYATSAGDAAGIGVMVLALYGIGLMIAVVVGLITANIMGKKGYGKGIGFVLGFFGGFVGLIVAIVLNEKTRPQASGYGAYAPPYPARGQVAATDYPAKPYTPEYFPQQNK